MAASMKDVAGLAGVSIKTVSNVVNQYPFVSESTRARVLEALRTLDYRPNMSARGLRTGVTNLIALAIPVLDEPYFGEIATQIVDAAQEHNWTVIIEQTAGERSREQVAAEGLRSNIVDGLIASPLAMTADDVADLAPQRPLVLLGERFARAGADHVAIDSVAAAYDATRHLLDLGRHRIAVIGAETRIGTAAMRVQGYQRALGEAGRTPDPKLSISVSPFHRTEGAHAMSLLLSRRQPPDAVFCVNDLLALGAIRTLITAGLRVPEDIAVIGIDDIEDGRFSTPSLSTIAPDKRAIATIAVDLLQQRIRGGDAGPPRDIVAGHRLMMRESTLGRSGAGSARGATG